ncbi:M23 family metallopeptidase [Streptomyces tropicalis]|uniref:M23 family metallopeptidase n=1 Tax=Streptomyces tropicalis TaxID=3034234 RepID=A0ABT6A178_9ACTN|nr:M23 family metallopeptidase [Streptomyces tropicalis]MDF3298396.1 M23 family metallopeptidase [Streptomyces tropicalis]
MRDTTGDPAGSHRSVRPDTGREHAAADALHRFVTAEPGDQERLAPRVVAAVGRERLGRIMDATVGRVGEVAGVRDTPDGLVIHGTRGQVLAFAATRDGRELEGLLIAPGDYRPPRLRIPLRARSALAWIVLALLLAVRIGACWEAPSRIAWCGRLLIVAAGYLLVEGWRAPAELPRPARRLLEAGALVALASAWRLPGLPTSGGDAAELVVGAALVGTIGVLLVRARRHRWGRAVSRPLVFPLQTGSWYVAQGGGRSMNHHAAVPEQRGALDIVRIGPGGTRARRRARSEHGSGRNESYLVYGQPVHAPCDGTVVSTADHIADQDPGSVRYQPLYGNHVWIDTGSEIVKLAHLRPGTVTVTTGDPVHAGQVLGAVGNSGNSSEPHLHLHAERDGLGLDLEFRDVPGPLYRGRTIRT